MQLVAIEDFFFFKLRRNWRYCKWWSWYMQLVAIEDFFKKKFAAIEGTVSDEVDMCS